MEAMNEAKLKETKKSYGTDLEGSIRKAREYLLDIQYPAGFWWGELESNVTITAEHLLLTHILRIGDQNLWEKIANYLFEKQLSSGAWNIYTCGPGDLSTTVEAYFALKLAGVSPDDPRMRKAKSFILSQGGIPKTRIFTKIWLAMFGQFPWKGVPSMPPELMFFPPGCPFNIYGFSSWARGTIVPMLIILTKKPTFEVPEHARLDELYPRPPEEINHSLPGNPKVFTWEWFFKIMDVVLKLYERLPVNPGREKAIQKAAEWVIKHQEEDGSWGGIQPPWVYSLIALKVLGYSNSHPTIAKGIEGFESFSIEEEDTFRFQACLSSVWDTALASVALLESGIDPGHESLVRAGQWLLANEVTHLGDWAVKNKSGQPGGWAFEFANKWYPDTDDTAIVMISLMGIEGLEEDRKEESLKRGFKWLVSMQSKNGGWASFDVNNTGKYITKLPFCDFGEVIDPPSVDVTAHVLELLGRMGYEKDFPPVRKALEYIKREQIEDGSWFGRWGVNYIYGTGAVLPALNEIGENMNKTYVQKAAHWLINKQNPDGGWGETAATYDNPELKGRGKSTASQTAWALLGLMASVDIDHPSITKGVKFLISTQNGEGNWKEDQFTGTGFPGDFMINYHLYRNYFPLMALGRYRNLREEKQ